HRKNTAVMASCGSNNAYGSTRLGKMVRFVCIVRAELKPAPRRGLQWWRSAVGHLEFADQLVAAGHERIQRLLSGLAARKQLLELLVDDVADLHVVAKA